MVKIKGGPDSDRMMRASESGFAARANAQQNLIGQIGEGTRQGLAMGQAAAGAIAQDRQLDQGDRQLDQREAETDLQAAQAGYVRNPRYEKLRQQLEGTGQGALDQPVEMSTDERRWIPSAEGEAATKHKQRMEAARAGADLNTSQARLLEAQHRANELRLKAGDDRAAATQKVRDDFLRIIGSSQKLLDDLELGRATELPEFFGDMAQLDPSVRSELEAMGAIGPDGKPTGKVSAQGVNAARLKAAVRSRIGYETLHYISALGEIPPSFDPSNPVLQDWFMGYNAVNAAFNQIMSMGIDQVGGDVRGAMANPDIRAQYDTWAGFKSDTEKQEFLRSVTAKILFDAQMRSAEAMSRARSAEPAQPPGAVNTGPAGPQRPAGPGGAQPRASLVGSGIDPDIVLGAVGALGRVGR